MSMNTDPLTTTSRKQKRSAATERLHWNEWLSKAGMYAAVIFAVLAVAKGDFLFSIYGTLAGMVMTFIWPYLALLALLGMMWKQYRGFGQHRKAVLTRRAIFSLLLVLGASLYLFMTGF